jgi:hypothetical protein
MTKLLLVTSSDFVKLSERQAAPASKGRADHGEPRTPVSDFTANGHPMKLGIGGDPSRDDVFRRHDGHTTG